MGSLLDNSLQLISNCSSQNLFVRLWPAPSPKGLIYIVHDLGGHCLLYDTIAEHLNEAGFAVAAHDHVGHGLSGGYRLHLPHYQNMVSDTEQCVREVRGFFPETDNTILLGHGFGGLLATLLAQKEPQIFHKLVLHNPLFKLAEERAKGTYVCWYLSYVTPFMPSNLSTPEPALLIQNKEFRGKFERDPFIWHDTVKMATIHTVVSALRGFDATESFPVPTLLQCGDNNHLMIDEAHTNALAKRNKGVELQWFHGGRHYLHEDTPETTARVLYRLQKFCLSLATTEELFE